VVDSVSGDPPQRLVDQGHQGIERRAIAFAGLLQQTGDVL
jgi:hypothetical protein